MKPQPRNDFLGRLRPPFSRLDRYWCIQLHQIEELDDVSISHPNAAVAARSSDFVFMSRAMNIDVAVVRVLIVRLQPIQPKDAGKNQIVRRRQGVAGAERNSTDEHGSAGRIRADLRADAELA